jgi:hypothetical protein
MEQYPKLAGKFHNHHIIPKFLGGDPNGESVRIPAAYHQQITNLFRELGGGYGRPTADPTDIPDIIEEVYRQFPITGFMRR